jgi:hypothetical protein
MTFSNLTGTGAYGAYLMDKLVIGEWDLERTSKDSRFICRPSSPIVRSQYSHEVSGTPFIWIGELGIEPLDGLEQGQYFDIRWWFI